MKPCQMLARVFAGDKDLVDPDTEVKYGQQATYTEQPCSWRLVERVSDTGTSSAPSLVDQALLRVPSGAPCPQSGIYFTPAKENSRRRFIKGEIMPIFESTYGATIWQWDIDQE